MRDREAPSRSRSAPQQHRGGATRHTEAARGFDAEIDVRQDDDPRRDKERQRRLTNLREVNGVSLRFLEERCLNHLADRRVIEVEGCAGGLRKPDAARPFGNDHEVRLPGQEFEHLAARELADGECHLRLVESGVHHHLDSGAVGADKTLEKEIVLTFSKEFAEALEATGRYDVRLTRQDDSFDAVARNDDLVNSSWLAVDGAGDVNIRADLTSREDLDYYEIVAPDDSDGTLVVSLDSSGLSLLAPNLSIYNDSGILLASVGPGGFFGRDSSSGGMATASTSIAGVPPATINLNDVAAGSRM